MFIVIQAFFVSITSDLLFCYIYHYSYKTKTGIPSLPKFKSRASSGGCPAFFAGYQNMYTYCTLRLVID